MKDIEEREAFERLYLGGRNLARRNEHGDYVLPSVQDAWSGWSARAAVEADRAQRVPDWSHPKVQALIGSDARKRVQIDLLWRILENPNDEFGPSDMEYWDAIHDRLKSALLASTPAQPAQQVKEMYQDGWSRVTLMVSPDGGTVHAVEGDRAEGDGDQPYLGFDRMKKAGLLAPAPAQQETALQSAIAHHEAEAERCEALDTDGECEVAADYHYTRASELRAMLPQHQEPPRPAERKPINCWCEACDLAQGNPLGRTRMSLCPECGDKRCPRAKHHDAPCNGIRE